MAIQKLRGFRLAWIFFRVGAMTELQYRANFFIQVFQSILSLGVGLVVLGLVFGHTASLNGWSRSELLAVLGVQILVGGLIHTLIQPNMERLMTDVRQGTLDYALTKPEDSQLMVSIREVRIWQATDVISGAIVLGVAIAQLGGGLGVVGALAFAVALLLGTLMVYCFWMVLTTGAFWVIRMDQIVELFDGVFQTGRWPVGIYPVGLRIGLTFVIPIAFAVTVPAEALTSRLNGWTLAFTVLLSVAFLVFTRWFWKRGLTHYSGASA